MQLPAYQKDIVRQLKLRLGEKRRFIQIITGPRQTGKTTAILQVLKELSSPYVYAASDSPAIHDFEWIETQ